MQDQQIAENTYEERAENLSKENLLAWTVLSEAERKIVKKLTGPGAKVLSGPRGSGKSTLFRVAFYEASRDKLALPVYVNYSKALAIEPLFHTHADAAKVFRQWVLAKIVSALQETIEHWGLTPPSDISKSISESQQFIKGLESGSSTLYGTQLLGPTEVRQLLSRLAETAEVNRTVLLLDDAAHAFSVKQQKEFFEVFRELRSRDIAAKAAIYPGVTSFSPTFQIGHEAELVETWFRPDNARYLATMRQLHLARFPHSSRPQQQIDLLALASFGLPRGFIGLCAYVDDAEGSASGGRAVALEAIGAQADVIRTIFENISDRLPRFKNFIAMGLKLEGASRESLRAFNKGKTLDKKATVLALSEPIPDELTRVLRFMEYAGLIRRVENLSKGVKGIYRRYLIHYSLLISNNALFLGKNYKLADVVEALKSPSAHSLVKTKAETLLGAGFIKHCVLALPPCPKCSTERVSEDQKFCMNCGYELRSASIYLDLLKTSVQKLPLPEKKKAALIQQGFTEVRHLLSDEGTGFRKRGTFIGAIWAKRILTVAEEWASV